MTRKDYVALARAIVKARQSLMYATTSPGETKRTLDIVIASIATALHHDNKRFCFDKFRNDCGALE